MHIHHFLNLTNGIEALPKIKSLGEPYSFIRIQSSLCEAKNWQKLLAELDYDFLMHLAIGDTCAVHDYSQQKESPRAIFQGLQFIRYVLERRWFGFQGKILIKGKDCTEYYQNEYDKIFIHSQDKYKDSIKSKLDYFKPYLAKSYISLVSCPGKTIHDSKKEFYRNILETHK